jgi:hypothetical protein
MDAERNFVPPKQVLKAQPFFRPWGAVLGACLGVLVAAVAYAATEQWPCIFLVPLGALLCSFNPTAFSTEDDALRTPPVLWSKGNDSDI